MHTARICGNLALIALAGCAHDAGRPSTDAMTRDQLNARADELTRQGEDDRLQGMNLNRGVFRRSANADGRLIRDGEDKLQEAQRLRALAATRP